MGDWTGIRIAKTWLVPDMRVIGRGGSQRDHARRFVAKVPSHTIHASASLGLQLADYFPVWIENFKLHWVFRSRLRTEGEHCLAAVREAVILPRFK